MAHGKPVIVPTLSVSCKISYRLRGVILSVPVDFVLDTGAAVSLIREDVWSRISKLEDAHARTSAPGVEGQETGWRQWFRIVCKRIWEVSCVPGRNCDK